MVLRPAQNCLAPPCAAASGAARPGERRVVACALEAASAALPSWTKARQPAWAPRRRPSAAAWPSWTPYFTRVDWRRATSCRSIAGSNIAFKRASMASFARSPAPRA
eukprot:7379297-Prymnesium_polylepis.1